MDVVERVVAEQHRWTDADDGGGGGEPRRVPRREQKAQPAGEDQRALRRKAGVSTIPIRRESPFVANVAATGASFLAGGAWYFADRFDIYRGPWAAAAVGAFIAIVVRAASRAEPSSRAVAAVLGYALALAHVPDRRGLYAFAELLQGALEELNLHAGYAEKWGIDLANVTASSATRNYTDFLLATAPVLAALKESEIDRDYRKKKEGLTASDHAPVMAEIGSL